jgi:hypothetical protein
MLRSVEVEEQSKEMEAVQVLEVLEIHLVLVLRLELEGMFLEE